MKASQNNSDFNPITITLETKEEANLLYQLLNLVDGEIVGRHMVLDENKFDKLSMKMFKTYSEIYEEST